ncbi:MAG: domain S-box protein [Chitinophagaceae bacterium]|nr:domain S-box protein [Chitinophagaceae bacterium]
MRFELKVLIGFLVTLSLVIVLGIYSYENNKNQLEASHWVNHTNEVLYRSEQLLYTLTSLEAAQRGYSLTGKTDFLIPYATEQDSVASQISYLFLLTADNPRQHERVTKLHALIRQKLLFNAQVITLRKTDVQQSIALISSLKGKYLMDVVKKTFTEFISEEKTLLEQRTLENQKQTAKFNLLFIATLSITMLILLILFYTIYINLRARKKVEKELRGAMADVQDLYDNAPCGYHSLSSDGTVLEINHTLLKWLGYMREEIIGRKKIHELLSLDSIAIFQHHFPLFQQQGFIYNVEFNFLRKDGTPLPVILNSSAILDEQGKFIKSRSTTFDYTEQKLAKDKINTLNQELEAFTYTVSHDLRSPLRSITGYTQILQEDFSRQLEGEGKRLIEVIIKSTRRMGQLIDDLLSFSQLGRKELLHNDIDMNLLVKQLVRELSEQARKHSLEINLHPLHPCHGDYKMIRQVWNNLLSNALKYSEKRENIRLEIASYIEEGETCYYVKDNGAGFDMQFVHKLFGVFQRLHRINEFEGTGVGLAIVKRIVTRHAGRVWAEGKLNEGAIFYFSIPNQL